MLEHTAQAITGAGVDGPVLLSTDDDAIAAEGERLGWSVPFRRPAHLSGDDATTVDVILHALDWFRESEGSDREAVLVLQPTSPFRGSSCIGEAVTALERRPDIDSVIAMSTHNFPANHVYRTGKDGIAKPVTRDTAAPVHCPNGALYLTRVKKLREQGTLYAGNILPLVLGPLHSVDIDTEEDWLLAEAISRSALAANRIKQGTQPAAEPSRS